MNNHVASTAREKTPKIGTYGAAVICGLLLVMSGCGIPEHRGPLPGTLPPADYSWNNGVNYWSPQPTRSPHEVDGASSEPRRLNDLAVRRESQFHPIRLASLVEPTGEEADGPAANLPDPDPASEDAIVAQPEEIAPGQPDAVYVPPYAENQSGTVCPDNSACIPFHAFFSDPFLLELIDQALVGNQELKILAEEIEIANNETYARSGEYLPFVTYGGAAELEKSSRFTRDGAVEDQLQVAPGRGFPDPLPNFLVATNVSWELDIWRKLRNARDAAAMRFLGTQEGRNYVVTRLVAEVAENYYELMALDNRQMTLQKTIEIQQQSLIVAQAKKDAGRGTELAVQRFRAEVAKNQSEILIIRQEIVEAENRINFLAGRFPQPVRRASAEYVNLNLNIPSAGLPCELLMNRADIRQAERAVDAAGLDVEVARARFYPSLGLHAGVGLEAYNMRYFFSTPESLIYNTALDLVGPLINKRAIQADYRSANAAQLQSIYHYQKTVLTAHIEVVNHMTKVQNYEQSIEVKKRQLASLEASVDTASKLFQNARAEYVEVLLAQREMMEAKMLLIEIKQEQLRAIINAYQSLGGGF